MHSPIMRAIGRYLAIGILIGIGIAIVDFAYYTWSKEARLREIDDFQVAIDNLFNSFSGVMSVEPQEFRINGKLIELPGRCDATVWLGDQESYQFRCNDFPAQTSIIVRRRTNELVNFASLIDAAVDGTLEESEVSEFSIKTFELDRKKMSAKLAEARSKNSNVRDPSVNWVDISDPNDPNTIYKHICNPEVCVTINTKSALVAEGIAAQLVPDDA